MEVVLKQAGELIHRRGERERERERGGIGEALAMDGERFSTAFS